MLDTRHSCACFFSWMICIVHKQMPSTEQPKQLWEREFVPFNLCVPCEVTGQLPNPASLAPLHPCKKQQENTFCSGQAEKKVF